MEYVSGESLKKVIEKKEESKSVNCDYEFITNLKNIIPLMKVQGLSDNNIDTLILKNPKRILSIEK